MTNSVFIVAAERSGDDLGAALVRDLRKLSSDISIQGIGGARMANEGVLSDLHIAPLSILGFTEALKSYPTILKLVRQATEIIMKSKCNMVVLIDSWGFTMRVAQSLRKAGFTGKLVKYVAPQVFAMREGRSKVLAKSYDHLMTIHSFDAHYFERHGLPVTYVGNPVYDTDYRAGNGAALRKRLDIEPNAPLLTVLFGSRRSEIARLATPFAETIEILEKQIPGLKVVSPVSESIALEVKAAVKTEPRFSNLILCAEADKIDIFAAANAALACSGTVTSQLAYAGVPTVVSYKVSGMTYFVGKRLFKLDYISLVNIAANKPLMPEILQSDATGENLSQALIPYLRDKRTAQSASGALMRQADIMKGTGGTASERAAKTVLSLL